MNQITDPPNVYDAGLEFDYAVWTADTEITLVNVPWNSDYRDIVNRTFDIDAYIDSRETTLTRTKVQYQRVNVPIKLDIPFTQAYRFNYVRVRNMAQPIPGDAVRTYYYFINDIRHAAPNTTEIVVQLDVWASFRQHIEIGNCFVERGHIGVANESQFDNFGRDYLTIPEGLDTGGEYQVVKYVQEDVITPFGPDAFSVLVASTIDLSASAGTIQDPRIVAASGGTFSGLPSGASYYVFVDSGSFGQYLSTIKDTPWVAQGFISITLIPNLSRYYSGFNYNAYGTPTPAPAGIPANSAHTMAAAWRNTILNVIPQKYRHLRKFITFPYMAIEMTTWSGTPLIIKPESWQDPSATIYERANLVPPSQRIQFYPKGYNKHPNVESTDFEEGEYLDFATVIQAFPTVALVNSNASMFMASNSNMLTYQQQTADWSQQKALMGNQLSYDQATSAIGLMDRLGVNSRNADIAQTALTNRMATESAILNSITSVAGGAAVGALGGPAGAVLGGMTGAGSAIINNINTLREVGANNESLGIRNSAALYENLQNQGQAGYVRDSNKSLADYAARGDYANQIAGIQAKIQDSKFVQPSVIGQVGGDTMNIIHLSCEISLRWKMLDDAHIRAIGDYWLRYGYAVSQFATIPDSLMCMTKFTYWKLAETYFKSSSMPEAFKQIIRGIFEKGVTVWANPDDMGRIDWADNEALEGIRL